ncbi:hypothetical protein AGMMS50229_14930 [Campylobacterota bacterium]|nr:hypothetical protein AGMMS50229_14930 [Campylobacterota bacterium]
MKKAFTFLEVIIVIVIVGILSMIAVPYLLDDEDGLEEAREQIIRHIRYAQHLAVMDDKFVPNDTNWRMRRWQIKFDAAPEVRYAIFSDQGVPDGVAIDAECARDPLTRRYLRSDSTDADLNSPDLDLATRYRIASVSMTAPFGSYASFFPAVPLSALYFDELGRPMGVTTAVVGYDEQHYLSRCLPSFPIACPSDNWGKITLTHENGKMASICIEPESGYASKCD